MIPPAAPPVAGPRPWWESRPFIAALILLSMLPLLYPPIPPLVDLFGHMGRFRVQLDLDSSPWLGRYYGFEWKAIGNLGVDLLLVPLSRFLDLETAVKLIVLTIPPMTVAGLLWIAREVHNRVPPTALFALPFAYGHPFMFGFVNFALSMAFAFLAFGLWLRLGRLGHVRLRALLFVPISILIFFTHTFGWGALGLLAFSAEAVRQHDRGIGWLRAVFNAALHASTMALPVVFMISWRSEVDGAVTGGWFLTHKIQWVLAALRDRWKTFDTISVVIVLAVLAEAVRNRKLTFSRNLGFSALVLLFFYLVLPYILMGSAYADMRLAPYAFAITLISVRFRTQTNLRLARLLIVLGLVFYTVRIGANTVSLAIASNEQQQQLKALDLVPMGARVANLSGQGCQDYWAMPRNSHLGAMAIVRRHAFSNDQWAIEGSNLLEVRYLEAGAFAADPSQIVRPERCRGAWTVNLALRRLPRDKFDYLWLIDVPPFDASLTEGLQRIWAGPKSTLYRIPKGGEGLQPARLRMALAPGR